MASSWACLATKSDSEPPGKPPGPSATVPDLSLTELLTLCGELSRGCAFNRVVVFRMCPESWDASLVIKSTCSANDALDNISLEFGRASTVTSSLLERRGGDAKTLAKLLVVEELAPVAVPLQLLSRRLVSVIRTQDITLCSPP